MGRGLPAGPTAIAVVSHSFVKSKDRQPFNRNRETVLSRNRVAIVSAFLLLTAAAHVHASPVLPSALTVESMVSQADWVVKGVMAVLVLSSVATLSIWIYKVWEVLTQRRAMARSLVLLASASGLSEVPELPDTAAQAMMRLARQEAGRYPPAQRGGHAEGVKERAVALIQRVEAGQQRRLSRGLSVLGSIGAAAPFIGLFGTVWGIMNSFIGIAQAQTTNLAVVAPGIAEALLTTAFGLVAAIPAVLAYNAAVRAVGGYRVRMNDAAAQVMCLLSRELEVEGGTRKVGVVHGL